MKMQLKELAVIVLVLVWGLAGCAPGATPPPPTQAPPAVSPLAAAVMGAAERLNAGDLEESLAFWADDALFYVFGLPTGSEIYTGKEQIRAALKENVASHFKEQVEILSVEGEAVTTRTTTWHDFIRQIGAAPLVATETYVMKNDKIASLTWTISPDSLAKLKPALATALPPAPASTPAAPSQAPASAMTITIAGGTCTYDGPPAVRPGEVAVTLDVKDRDKEAYALYYFTLDSGKGLDDLMAATVSPYPPGWAHVVSGNESGLPGKQTSYSIKVSTGPLYLICWSKPPDLAIGGLGPFEVSQ